MKLALYYAPMTCALVPYVTLTEAGADFDVVNVNTRANQHKTPEFLALSPKHKVHPHLAPNARPENYCDLPGSEESVKRVGNRLLFEDLAIADALLAAREWFFDHFTAVYAYFFRCFRRAMSFGLDVSPLDPG